MASLGLPSSSPALLAQCLSLDQHKDPGRVYPDQPVLRGNMEAWSPGGWATREGVIFPEQNDQKVPSHVLISFHHRLQGKGERGISCSKR